VLRDWQNRIRIQQTTHRHQTQQMQMQMQMQMNTLAANGIGDSPLQSLQSLQHQPSPATLPFQTSPFLRTPFSTPRTPAMGVATGFNMNTATPLHEQLEQLQHAIRDLRAEVQTRMAAAE